MPIPSLGAGFVVLAGALLSACATFPASGTRDNATLVLTHATVIDVARGLAQRDMTVVISGNRISAVERSTEARPPAGIRVVDATGKYLIPGLWDMHVHLFNNAGRAGTDNADWYFPLLIANGVTGVRDMWTDPADLERPASGGWNPRRGG